MIARMLHGVPRHTLALLAVVLAIPLVQTYIATGLVPRIPTAVLITGLMVIAALLAFLIVITGGLGSMPGALVGGVLIGVTEAMAGLLFTPSAKSMFSFALLVIVLLFRPQGLLGTSAR